MALNEIIAECGLVCPYDDELVSHLDKACTSYFEANELDESQFSEWVICYMKGTFSSDIRDFVEDYLQNLDLDEILLPDCVWSALTFYFIYRAIVNNDSEEQKAIFSCSLQNLLLTCKGRWDTLNFQNQLVDLYGEFNRYLEKNEVGTDDVSMDFVSSIFDGSLDTLDLEEEDDDRINLEAIGKCAWSYKIEHYWDSSNHKEEKNPFLRILYFLDYWYKNVPSIYIKTDVMQLMDIAKVTKYTSKKSLSEVISSLAKTGNVLFESPISKSSLIVQMAHECKTKPEGFVAEKLSCQEFFVYLYFELLLELKLKENVG